MQLAGLGLPGLLYTLEPATNLNSPVVWTSLGTDVADNAGVYQFDPLEAVTEARQNRTLPAGTTAPMLVKTIDLANHLLRRAMALESR